MIRHLALFLLCLPAPALSQDIFSRMEGTFGSLVNPALICRENPHHLTFSTDRRRALFRLDHETLDYEGKPRLTAEYTVLGHDESSITMALDGESRHTDAGEPVVWILREATSIDGYCWGRQDWPPLKCFPVNVRCQDDQTTS